jgi:hypothetical protein
MTHLSVRWPMPIVVTIAIAAVATLGMAVNARLVDRMLDSSSGIFAILCALIAIGRLARGHLSSLSRLWWLAVLVIAVVVASLEFAEPFSELKGHDFGIDNIDDMLLLVAAPVGLWLTSRIEPRSISAQILLTAGLAAQLCGAVLDLLSDRVVANLGLTVGLAESDADFAQFLSLLCYFMAMWLLIGGASWASASRERTEVEAGHIKTGLALRRSMRDTIYPPPFLMGLGLADSGSSAGRVHRLCNEALWPAGNVLGAARNLGTIILWPLIAAVRAVPEVRKNGAAVLRLTGKSHIRQFFEQVQLAISCRIEPRYYYIYEFYRPGQTARAPHYLMRYQTKEIAYRLLYPVTTDAYEPAPLKEKTEFARHCRAHGIRHAPVLMLFEDGKRIMAPDLIDRLPEADVFVKRTNAKGGVRSELWRYTGNDLYRDTHGQTMDAISLVAHVTEISRDKPFFIQQAVKNHHDLLGLGAGALSTVRMLSVRNEAGDYEVTDAAFRMSVNPASAVDNFHAGGIAAAVDVKTGRLGRATDLGKGPDFKWHDVHPLTGAQITGHQLPMWRETVELAVRAHRAFPDYALVGWDIAVLEDGPCVIEGNRGPDVDIHQRTSLGPIGEGRFGELLAYNLEHRTGSR